MLELKNLEKVNKSHPFIIGCIGFYAGLQEGPI
jgi:hypothetical protein